MERNHSLDRLRASMMLLGVWLHTVVGYSREGGWPYKDPQPTALFDWTLALIHVFRMPLFMAMAGFFGALLWARRGPGGFAANRAQRILVPFVLGWLAVMPLSLLMAAYATTRSFASSIAFFTSGAFVGHLHPGHLWFLEYLLALYLIVGLAGWLVRRFAPAALRRADAAFRRVLRSSWRALLCAAPSAAALASMRHGWLEDPPGFVPVPRLLVAYLIPFVFGWLLYRNRDLLASLERDAWRHLGLATALFAGWMLAVAPHEQALGSSVRYLRAGAGAVLLWTLILGLTGVFLRYASAPSPLWRYLSDGSYWMYLVHMPVVMAFQLALARVPVAADLKVLLVALASALTLVASYDLLARSTWVGGLLNGRRHPRRFFTRSVVPEGSPRVTGLPAGRADLA